MQVTFMLCSVISVLSALDMPSMKNFVPEYTPKPGNDYEMPLFYNLNF